jgi:hypothetical protein
MTRTRTQRLLSVLSVVALLLAGSAVPALAAASGTATLLTPNIFAGSGGAVTIEVTNDASGGVLGLGAGNDIDAVQVFVPTDVFAPGGDADIQGPEGWTGFYDVGLEVAYFLADDGGIAPGEAAQFVIAGQAQPQADDAQGDLFVQVSDDGGVSSSSAGVLTLTARILEIVTADIVKPAFAFDTDARTVTSGQDSAPVHVQVRNHGTATRTVEATVETGPESTSSASGSGSGSVASGATSTIEVPTVFGAAGTLNLIVRAASASSTARNTGIGDVTVQPAAQATYREGSLAPRTVVPGNPTTVKVAIDKTGPQAVRLASLTDPQRDGGATLTIDTYESTIERDLPAGDTAVNLEFPVTVPESIPDGTYTPTLGLVGYDANGAFVDIDPVDLDQLVLDRLLPVVNVVATPDDPVINGATRAATDGWNITFSGTVREGGAGGPLCESCTVERAVIVAGSTELPVEVTLNGGQISGSDSVDFPDGTTTAYLDLTVVKGDTGLPGDGASPNFAVDLVIPALESAVTGRDADGDFVDVTFTELIGNKGMSAADWRVDGNTVTSIEPAPEPANPADPSDDGETTLRLRLAQAFEDSNARPAVQYAPTPLSRRAFDRVDQGALDATLTALDGIAPAAPVIQMVSGLEQQDGAFWTNDSTPSMTLAGIEVDGANTVAVYRDLDGDGELDADERTPENRLGATSADGEQVTVDALDDLGSNDTQVDVVAVVIDAASNASPAAAAVLQLDFTAPVISGFVDHGDGTVTVTFDEPIARGRNAAFDWTVTAEQDGTTRSRPVETVSGSGDERLLSVSAAAFDPSRGEILGVTYRFRGSDPDDRYEDRATNELIDMAFPPEL